MTPQFYLTQPAIQGIEDIAGYTAARRRLEQAERFLSKFDTKFVRITQFPYLITYPVSLPLDDYGTKSY